MLAEIHRVLEANPDWPMIVLASVILCFIIFGD